MSEKNPLISKKDWIRLIEFEPQVEQMLRDCIKLTKEQTIADVEKIIDNLNVSQIIKDVFNREIKKLKIQILKSTNESQIDIQKKEKA